MLTIDWTNSKTVYWQKYAMPKFDPTSAFCPERTKRFMDDLSRRHNGQAAAQGVNTLVSNATKALNINDPEQ